MPPMEEPRSPTPKSLCHTSSGGTTQPSKASSGPQESQPASNLKIKERSRSVGDKKSRKKTEKTNESKPGQKEVGAAKSPEAGHPKKPAKQLGSKSPESDKPKPGQKEADAAEIPETQHPEQPAQQLGNKSPEAAGAEEVANKKSSKPPATSNDANALLMKKRGSIFTDFMGKLSMPGMAEAKEKKKKSEVSARSRRQLDSRGLHELLASNLSTSATPARPLTSYSASGRRNLAQHGTAVLATTAVVVLLLFTVIVVPMMFATAICETAVCRYYADMLRDSLNDAVSPCDDFHAHVCSRWEGSKTVAVREHVYRQFVQRVSEMATTTAVPPERQTAVQKAALFFQSCRNVYRGQRSELELIRKRLLDFGVFWPEMRNESRLVRTLVSASAAWNWGSVIQLYTWKPGRFTLSPTLIFGLTLLRREAMLSPTGGQSSYKQYFDKMVDAFRRNDGKAISYAELIELESKIIPLLAKPYVAASSTTRVNARLDELEALSLGIVPKVVWKEELQNYFNITVDPIIDIENVEFIKEFFRTVKNVGEEKMMYYVGWTLVQATSLLTNAELVRYFFQTEALADYGHQEICFAIGRIYMGVPMFARYVRTSVTPAVLRDASSLLRILHHSLRQRIENASVDWSKLVSVAPFLNESESIILNLVSNSDDKHLDKLYERFPDMTASIITNLELATQGRRATEENTEAPNFYHFDTSYSMGGRSFSLLPMAFEPPAYHEHAPIAVKFGALGGEMADGFARVLSAALPAADAETRYKLESKASCELGGNGTGPSEALSLGLRAMSMNTLYEEFVLHKGSPYSLPVGDRKTITGAKLFFILWCYVQCGAPNAKSQCKDLLRVLSHFHRVFGCSPGSGMFPGHVCNMK
ncbi:neprilysin-1-like [Amblyomma americanum]